VPLPQLWVREPLAPFHRNGEQGGGAFPRTQLRVKLPARNLGKTEETPGRHFHFQIKPQLANNFNVYTSTIHYGGKSWPHQRDCSLCYPGRGEESLAGESARKRRVITKTAVGLERFSNDYHLGRLKPIASDVCHLCFKVIVHCLQKFFQRISRAAGPAAQLNPPSRPVNLERTLALQTL